MAAKPVATFADRLNEIMILREKKQADICRDLHLSKSTVSQYVNGISVPKTDRTYDIAKYLHCDPVWLSGYDVPMEKIEMEPLDLSGMTPDQVRRVMAYVELVRKGEL